MNGYTPSPMLTRPDTPAKLAVEDNGLDTVIENCQHADMSLLMIQAELWPATSGQIAGTVLTHTTIQN